MEEKNLTIKWIDFENKIVKFDELTVPIFDLSEAVNEFAKKTQVSSKSKVSVKIDTSKGEHGTIENIKLLDALVPPEVKKEEPKQEVKDEAPKVDIIFKINEFSSTNNTVLFEGNTSEFKLDKKVSYYMQKANIGKGTTVKIEQDTNGVITKIQRATTEQKSTPTTNDYDKKPEDVKKENPSLDASTYKKSYGNSDVQRSIESQASVNSSCEIVSSMINDKTDPDLVLRMIKKIAEANFKLIQELKQN